MRIIVGLVGWIAVSTLGAACAKSEAVAPVTYTTSASAAGNGGLRRMITHARCEREAVCNNVGTEPGMRYDSLDGCVDALDHDGRVNVREADCPRGLSSIGVSDCLHQIRADRCGHDFSLDRYTSCNREGFCL